MRGDPVRLRQILNNLIGNAIKFTERGEVVLEVMPAASDTIGEPSGADIFLRFAVKDTGIGIAPEVKESLFRPFSQADSSITRRYGGTGLGLAITRQLVELMRGAIDLENEIGKGSTFRFTIRSALDRGRNRAAASRGP